MQREEQKAAKQKKDLLVALENEKRERHQAKQLAEELGRKQTELLAQLMRKDKELAKAEKKARQIQEEQEEAEISHREEKAMMKQKLNEVQSNLGRKLAVKRSNKHIIKNGI